MNINQKAIQSVPIYRAGNVSRQWVEAGQTDGWMPVFDAPQNVLTKATNDPGVTSLADAAAVGAVLDLSGADGFALTILGVPVDTANRPVLLQVWFLEPVKSGLAEKPIGYSWNCVTETSGSTINFAGASVQPGSLAGSFGITTSHRFVQNAGTTGSSTNWMSVPYYNAGTKARLHYWSCGCPFAVIRVIAVSGESSQLQALWRPICVNEVRGSALGV